MVLFQEEFGRADVTLVCVRVCVHACVRACMCVHACVCECDAAWECVDVCHCNEGSKRNRSLSVHMSL